MGRLYVYVAIAMVMMTLNSAQARNKWMHISDPKNYDCNCCPVDDVSYRYVTIVEERCDINDCDTYIHEQIDSLAASNNGSYFIFELKNEKLPYFFKPLFSSNYKVLEVILEMPQMNTLHGYLFRNQEDNIRKVLFPSAKLMEMPQPALYKLKNMVELQVWNPEFDMEVRSFEKLPNPSALSVLNLKCVRSLDMFYFHKNALWALTNLTELKISGEIWDVNSFVDALPKNMTNLQKLSVTYGILKSFPTSLFQKIAASNADAELVVDLGNNEIKTMSEADWKLVLGYTIRLQGNPIECSCHMIRMAYKYNKLGRVDGQPCLRLYQHSTSNVRDKSKADAIKKLRLCNTSIEYNSSAVI